MIFYPHFLCHCIIWTPFFQLYKFPHCPLPGTTAMPPISRHHPHFGNVPFLVPIFALISYIIILSRNKLPPNLEIYILCFSHFSFASQLVKLSLRLWVWNWAVVTLLQDIVRLGLAVVSGSAPCALICVQPDWPAITQDMFFSWYCQMNTEDQSTFQVSSYVISTNITSAKASHSQTWN